ncbi:MAG: biopolymer transporter ExbD [Bacteroidota bacterium]
MKKSIFISIAAAIGIIMLVGIVVRPNLSVVESTDLKISVPTEPTTKGEKIDLIIDKDGHFYIDGTEVAEDKLEEKLIATYKEDGNLTVIVRAADNTEINKVINIMDICNKNNIKVVLGVSPE